MGIAARPLRRVTSIAVGIALVIGLAGPPVLAIEPGTTPSTTSLSAPSLDPKPVGRLSDLTATVTDGATGGVTFYVDNVEMATVPLSGNQATWSVPADALPGTRSIEAEYSGDATYMKSEASRTITVGPRPVIVGLVLTGPNDPTGASARRGDMVTAIASVADHGTTGSLDVAGGTVDIKVGGVTKGTVTLPATSVDLDTAAWAPGTNNVVAVFVPSAAEDHAGGSSPGRQIFIEMGHATAQYPMFYPYKDGYRDTVALRGTRFQPSSVAIKIVSPTGKTVRTLSVPLGSGSWSVPWNGRNTAGSVVAAGKYKVVSTITAGTAKQSLTTYTTVSAKRLYTYTKSFRKTVAQRSAGSLSSGWLGWKFSVPSATVYKKLVFAVYGKSGTPRGIFGPHSYAYCPSTTRWDWYECMAPYSTFPASASWKSVAGSVTRNRHGTTVRMYAVGGNRTAVQYARVTVTYGVLR